MFAALEEVAEEHMILQDHLNEVREINQAKLVEREKAEAECQEVRSFSIEIVALAAIRSFSFSYFYSNISSRTQHITLT